MRTLEFTRHNPLARIHQLCNAVVAGVWIYQGLVPKWLGPHADEQAMTRAFGIAPAYQDMVSYVAGSSEILLGLCILLYPRQAWPQWLSAVAMAVLLLFALIYVPQTLVGAFNPVVMNVASGALSVVALMALRATPPD